MSIKITFSLPADIVADATSGLILGEFNNWDATKGTSLKKQKDGSMKATISLEPGQTYQYRYLLNDGRWVNDHNANDIAYAHGYDVENCVITVPLAKDNIKKILTDDLAKVVKDDLAKIEGIGKKIADLLAASGIISFEGLAKATPKKLKSILDNAGTKFKIHDPATWPKQAKLAAAGKWPELKKMQGELKGGK